LAQCGPHQKYSSDRRKRERERGETFDVALVKDGGVDPLADGSSQGVAEDTNDCSLPAARRARQHQQLRSLHRGMRTDTHIQRESTVKQGKRREERQRKKKNRMTAQRHCQTNKDKERENRE
jgi:hypothetical protein